MKQMSAESKALYQALQQFRKKRIQLSELRALCVPLDTYREQILELTSHGYLQPVKSSGTDGNLKKTLYLRYTIQLEETPQIPLEDIYSLHPRLTANGYLLRNREQFARHKDILLCLSEWLTHSKSLSMMSRRERSFLIFGDEKILDHHLKLMENIGISGDILHYYETPEQCFSDYIPVRKPHMTLIICENKDIWFNVRRLMYENDYHHLFDVRIDGVIFGQGNDITGQGKLLSYSCFLGTEQVRYLYCGDIDRAGFDIFLRLCKAADKLDISLFVPAYQKMLELGKMRRLPNSEDERSFSVDLSQILPLFEQEEQEQLTQLLQENKRLPQEILSYPILAENMR